MVRAGLVDRSVDVLCHMQATVDVSQKLMSSEESAGFISSTGSDKDY